MSGRGQIVIEMNFHNVSGRNLVLFEKDTIMQMALLNSRHAFGTNGTDSFKRPNHIFLKYVSRNFLTLTINIINVFVDEQEFYCSF